VLPNPAEDRPDPTQPRLLAAPGEQLALAVEQSVQAVVTLATDNRILHANGACRRILGLTKEGLDGKDFGQLMEGLEGEPVLDRILREAQGGRPWQGRVLAMAGDGSKVYLGGSVTPVRSLTGEVTSLLVIFRDVTREAELDHQLGLSQKMDALGALAGGVAHDFNNILSAILTATELMEWQLEGSSSLRSKVEIIHQASLRARALNQQILAFSRKGEDRRIPFDLSRVVKEVASLLRSTSPKSLTVHTDIASSIWITGDPSQFHQVVMNLAINGRHAMKEQGGVLSLGLSEVEWRGEEESKVPAGLGEEPYALLTVRDTGHGMKPEIQSKIFEPFFTTKPQGEGTGLGLSVVHGIVHRCGGTIDVDSAPGKGTTFRIFLPCTSREPENAWRPPEDAAEEDLGGREHILFVDDDDIVAALARQGLQALGYRVTPKTLGAEALELFRERPESFDLLMADLDLPDLSGTQLTHRMQLIRPDLPVIFIAGLSRQAVAPLEPPVAYQEILAKPLVTKDLARAIRRVLGCHGPGTPPAGLAGIALAKWKGLQGGQGPTILFAEDNTAVRSLVRSWLVRGGYRVIEARDGQEAWEIFCAAEDPSTISMLLTDLKMPRMDGLELAQMARKKDPEVPVLVISTSDDADHLKQALSLHVDGFLKKPFGLRELLEQVRRLVAKRTSGLDVKRSAETVQAVRLAQRSMASMPEQDLPIFSICEPLTDAGGDVFRCIRRPDGTLLLVLADVAGHSVLSSYAVASFLGMLTTFARDWRGLRDLFHRLNQAIQLGPFPGIPIAMGVAHWDPRTGRMHIVNAGIPYGVHYRRNLGRTEIRALNGAPLGLLDDPLLGEKVLVLAAGDRLLFGTDGLFDAPSAERIYFRDRLPSLWENAADLPLGDALSAMCEAAKQHGDGTIQDDLLVMGLEQPPFRPEAHELLQGFPSVLGSVEAADRTLEQVLDGHPIWRNLSPARHFQLVLALHEAMTNAIEHGNLGDPDKRVDVACRLTDASAFLRVVDEGPGFNLEAHSPGATAESERGRGLAILKNTVSQLSMCRGELTFRFDLEGTSHANQP
jgi:PAS domain S-box-containing protein